MKHVTKKLFCLSLLASTMVHAATDDVHGLSYFMGQRNSAFTSNGLIQQANHCGKEADTLTAHLSGGIEFSKSMQNDKLAGYFTPSGAKTISFGTEASTTADVFSLNFWLPFDHVSTVTLNPEFTSLNFDFRLHVGLDEFIEHAWFAADLPVVRASWDLGLTENVTTPGTTTIVATKFGAAQGSYPYTSPITAMQGDKSLVTNTVGIAPLTYGKWSAKKLTETSVGDVKLALGYDFINKDNAQLGLGVLGHISGADVSDAKYINTPSIGTAGRHGIGGRLDGSVRLWESNDWSLAAHLRADYAYIFEATVRRSFDFTANGDWSRYLLVSKHTAFNIITEVTNAINVTSLQAKIGQFHSYDANLMFSLTNNAWEVNLGYNFAGMTKEKLKSFVDTIPTSTYTFYSYTTAPVAVAAAGDNASRTHTPLIQIDGSAGTKGTVAPAGTSLTTADLLASNAITNDSLDKSSGLQPETMHHRIYGNIGYTYESNEWMPRVSVGGSAELSSDNHAVRQWGVHGTVGICF